MTVARLIARVLARRARESPVVVLTGPRQSGKTTLVREVFKSRPYVNLEAPDVRARAHDDPRGFLANYPRGAILDEVQRAPALLSYLQVDVDEHRQAGRWILSGSQNLALIEAVSQSLAGRAALLELLPLGMTELRAGGWLAPDLFTMLWRGAYPAPFDRGESPSDWFSGYVATYVERDVRTMLNVGDLHAFQTFVRLAASRTGQILNLSQLGADVGITHNTARSWISVLEASYLLTRLQPYSGNFGSRLVKAPKLHMLDTGLACFLLGIRTPDELELHPLRGPLFESWVVSEVLKAHRNAGVPARLSYVRDAHGLEVDLLLERGPELVGVEVKSGATVPLDAFRSLTALGERLPAMRERIVVHGGGESWRTSVGSATSFRELDSIAWLDARSRKARTSPRASRRPR